MSALHHLLCFEKEHPNKYRRNPELTLYPILPAIRKMHNYKFLTIRSLLQLKNKNCVWNFSSKEVSSQFYSTSEYDSQNHFKIHRNPISESFWSSWKLLHSPENKNLITFLHIKFRYQSSISRKIKIPQKEKEEIIHKATSEEGSQTVCDSSQQGTAPFVGLSVIEFSFPGSFTDNLLYKLLNYIYWFWQLNEYLWSPQLFWT